MLWKDSAKNILGGLPLTAEIFWMLRQSGQPPVGGYHLDRVKDNLQDWVSQAQSARKTVQRPKRVLIFSMIGYWIEHSLLMSLALAALGHEITLAYLPYAQWKRPVNRFDIRRQNLYLQDTLKPAETLIKMVPFLDAPLAKELPKELADLMDDAAFRDTQYSELREDVEVDSDLYRLRLERNRRHALRLLAQIEKNRPNVIVVPNGSILEFGITYHVARYLGIPVMTFEFGEQNDRMWLAQDDDVMRQDTGPLWEANKEKSLSEDEWSRVKDFFSARQKGDLWETFVRLWQETPVQQGGDVRQELGLDSRPVVFLPTNVLGDSLTLGRQLFSSSMTEWLQRTIEYFLGRDDVQFVIKTHPGELIGWGPAVYDILNEKFPNLPDHIHLLAADAKVNAYDLVHVADVGLVFTTTLGMEMAMSGLPVIVTGQTHYRDKGFTQDPDSWDEFFETLQRVLKDPQKHRPSRTAVEAAWTYAYRFFFKYPQPYPWHVQYFEDDIQRWPLAKVLSDEGMAIFGRSFEYLLGKPIVWTQ